MKRPGQTRLKHHFRYQFSLRALFVATLLIAATLPTGITHFNAVTNWMFPAAVDPSLPRAADIIPSLLRRVPPSSAKEIAIPPVEVTVLITSPSSRLPKTAAR